MLKALEFDSYLEILKLISYNQLLLIILPYQCKPIKKEEKNG